MCLRALLGSLGGVPTGGLTGATRWIAPVRPRKARSGIQACYDASVSSRDKGDWVEAQDLRFGGWVSLLVGERGLYALVLERQSRARVLGVGARGTGRVRRGAVAIVEKERAAGSCVDDHLIHREVGDLAGAYATSPNSWGGNTALLGDKGVGVVKIGGDEGVYNK